jgi:hypothetical protein
MWQQKWGVIVYQKKGCDIMLFFVDFIWKNDYYYYLKKLLFLFGFFFGGDYWWIEMFCS